jgi:hypothetical protein
MEISISFRYLNSILRDGIDLIILILKLLCIHSVCLKPSVEDFRIEINSSVSESLIVERSKSSKRKHII